MMASMVLLIIQPTRCEQLVTPRTQVIATVVVSGVDTEVPHLFVSPAEDSLSISGSIVVGPTHLARILTPPCSWVDDPYAANIRR